MPAITKIDRAACRAIEAVVLPDLERAAALMGLTLKRENGRFDPAGTFTMKVTFVTLTEAGVPSDWSRHAPTFGLAPEDFGKTFMLRGTRYTICGIKPRAVKYPVLAKGPQGGLYKFSASSVKAGLIRLGEKALR